MKADRRKFLRQSLASTAGLLATTLPQAKANLEAFSRPIVDPTKQPQTFCKVLRQVCRDRT